MGSSISTGKGLARAPGMLPRLTSLRIFGALAVFLYHVGHFQVASLPEAVYRLGYVGVAFFFVLSGFVLAWGTRPGLPARTFYRRRFARVWPSHFVMLLVAAVVPVVSVARSWEAAIANSLLVQAWFVGAPSVVFGMNGPSWSLSCEAFFYATFPLAVVILRPIPQLWRWVLCAVALLLAAATSLLVPMAAFHFPVIRYSEFLLGMVAGLAVRDGWRPKVSASATGLLLVAATAGCMWLPMPLPNTVMAVPFLLLLLCVAGRDLDDTASWLSGRAFVFAGEASYAFYLVHEVVIVNLRSHLTGNGLLDTLILVALSAVSAVVLHLCVERPANRLIRGRSRSIALQLPTGHPEGRALEAGPPLGQTSAEGTDRPTSDGTGGVPMATVMETSTEDPPAASSRRTTTEPEGGEPP